MSLHYLFNRKCVGNQMFPCNGIFFLEGIADYSAYISIRDGIHTVPSLPNAQRAEVCKITALYYAVDIFPFSLHISPLPLPVVSPEPVEGSNYNNHIHG